MAKSKTQPPAEPQTEAVRPERYDPQAIEQEVV